VRDRSRQMREEEGERRQAGKKKIKGDRQIVMEGRKEKDT